MKGMLKVGAEAKARWIIHGAGGAVFVGDKGSIVAKSAGGRYQVDFGAGKLYWVWDADLVSKGEDW